MNVTEWSARAGFIVKFISAGAVSIHGSKYVIDGGTVPAV
jgi:hypothetical protein